MVGFRGFSIFSPSGHVLRKNCLVCCPRSSFSCRLSSFLVSRIPNASCALVLEARIIVGQARTLGSVESSSPRLLAGLLVERVTPLLSRYTLGMNWIIGFGKTQISFSIQVWP
jgi:hypothetical protein